jgi:hypothetical protein
VVDEPSGNLLAVLDVLLALLALLYGEEVLFEVDTGEIVLLGCLIVDASFLCTVVESEIFNVDLRVLSIVPF